MKKFKILSTIISLGLAMMLFTGCGSKSKTTTTDQKQDTQNTQTAQKEEIKLDKSNAINIEYSNVDDYKTIYNSFKENKSTAKDKYIGKTVKISGEVSRVEKTNDYIIVWIMAKGHAYDAGLYFKNTEENDTKTTKLKEWGVGQEGDKVTAYGIFEEFGKIPSSNDYLKITNCEFV